MPNGCQELYDEIEKNWTKTAFEWSSQIYDNCRPVVGSCSIYLSDRRQLHYCCFAFQYNSIQFNSIQSKVLLLTFSSIGCV